MPMIKTDTTSQTIEFTVEKNETYTIRRRGAAMSLRCQECDFDGEMVKPEEASVLVGIDLRNIYRRIELGSIHFAEIPDGAVLVCLNSLGNEGNERQIDGRQS